MKALTNSIGTLSYLLFACIVAHGGEEINHVTVASAPIDAKVVTAKTDRTGTIHLLYDTNDGPRYAKSADHGKSFGTAISVVDSESKKPGLEFHGADMAVGKDGMIHVAMSTNAWKLKLPQSEWALFYANLEPGAKSFSPVRNLNGHPSEGFSLAADNKGNVTSCWLSGKLYANVSRDNGTTFDPQVEINPAYDPCNCCTTSSVYGTDGKLAVLYREETNDERDMYLILWDQDRGEVSRTRISSTLWKISACPMSAFIISRTKDGYVAVWPTKDQIYFARLDSKGNILSPGEIKTAGTAGMHTGMLALSATDGTTLVGWKKDDQLQWQLYDSDGQPTGSLGSVHGRGNGVAGVVENDGHFILFR
jgi:hypothetical protein